MTGITPYGLLGFAPYGLRWEDDTASKKEFSPKSLGYFGAIPTKSGLPMTELSTTFDINGKMVSVPLLVPTLNKDEINILASGKDIPDSIFDKAYNFAVDRIKKGKDPFAQTDEIRLMGLLGM